MRRGSIKKIATGISRKKMPNCKAALEYFEAITTGLLCRDDEGAIFDDIDYNIIGMICSFVPSVDSVIIDPDVQEKIVALCDSGEIYKWTLIYRGSRDGFRPERFHEKCDNQSATVALVQVDDFKSDGLFYGGYSSISWTSTYRTVPDPLSFIFSGFKNGERVSRFELRDGTVWHDPYIGPYYGTCDLCLLMGKNGRQGYSLLHDDISPVRSLATLCGLPFHAAFKEGFCASRRDFDVSEIEVFAVA